MITIATMSDLLKAMSMHQFSWCNKQNSLGPDGLSDQTIKDGMKQPDGMKISLVDLKPGPKWSQSPKWSQGK